MDYKLSIMKSKSLKVGINNRFSKIAEKYEILSIKSEK